MRTLVLVLQRKREGKKTGRERQFASGRLNHLRPIVYFGLAALIPLVVCIASPTNWAKVNYRGASATNAAGKQPMTVRDVLSVREIVSQSISSDGRAVAFVVKDAQISSNDYKYTLFVTPAASSSGGRAHTLPPKELLSIAGISNVRWAPGNNAIDYLSDGKIWEMEVAGGKPSQLLAEEEMISEFEWAPDGKSLAFISAAVPSVKETADAAAKGIVFRDDVTFDFWRFVTRSWISKPSRIWIFHSEDKKITQLMEKEGSIQFAPGLSISGIEWAPDNKSLAVIYNTSASTSKDAAVAFDSGIGVIAVDQGKLVPLPFTHSYQTAPSWSPDSSAIAYVGEVEASTPRAGYRGTLLVQALNEDHPHELTPGMEIRSDAHIWWRSDGKTILFSDVNREAATLYEVAAEGGKAAKIAKSDAYLSEFSFSADRSVGTCIAEGSMEAPELASVATADGRVTELTDVNSSFQHIDLGQVSKITWNNKFGVDTFGYLVKPVGYEPGKRYPLLIILYGFHGSFITQAEWISSYPAQPFAANGFAVLLMTQPKEYGWSYGNFVQFGFDRDYNALASIEAAVQYLDGMGIADPKRAGIMGWSYGSELTNLAITHSHTFAAASAGSGGANNPGDYWLFGGPFQHYIEGTMGGSPYADYDKRFDDLSTVKRAEQVTTPLLIESSPSEMLGSLEFYTKLKRLGKPVQMVIYPDEGHIYSQPAHRIASMQRNLDWFRFWLQDYEDSAADKRDQYSQWQALKEDSRKTNEAMAQRP
jgi:dipeptidyl aminopeptidase/acylaminoacyl peptidase